MAINLMMGLSLLVILHEFGHYAAARAFGIKVEKFYLFFDAWGIKLFKFKKGDTEYGIGWLPLGGYVKIAGMIDESMDKEAMEKPAEPWEFRSKPAWQRLIVMLGGVVMNVIVGLIIFTAMNLSYTKEYMPTDEVNKTGIYAFEDGRNIGFETGDKLIAVNGKKIKRVSDAISIDALFGSKITVERNGQEVIFEIPDTTYRLFKKRGVRIIGPYNYNFSIDSVLPKSNAYKAGFKNGDVFIAVGNDQVNSFGLFTELLAKNAGNLVDFKIQRNNELLTLNAQVDSFGKLGFAPTLANYTLGKYSFGEAVKYGTAEAFETVVVNAKGVAKIFEGKEKVQESLQGPIGMAKIYGGVWGDWYRFWRMTGLISMILAVMNILPIPALDGGHVIFLTIEAVTGRKFSDKFMENAQMVGMIMLLSLMVFVIGNDIYKLF